MADREELAVALAKLGFRIFPLLPFSKRPYSHEGWKAIRTTDEATIRRWFIERPEMNYAVNCDDEHVIFDLDEGGAKQKTGIANFQRAEAEAEGFVEDSIYDGTLRVRTPKGGVHLYFVADQAYANSVSTLIPDVDVRGPDGYVVGPGCFTLDDPEHNTVEGDYTITCAQPIAPVPRWLRQKLQAAGTVQERVASADQTMVPVDHPALIEKAKEVLRQRAPAIEGEGGDEQTYQTAVALRDAGVSPETALQLMWAEPLFGDESWNDTCQPSWAYDDLFAKVHNAYTYAGRPIGSKADMLAMVGEPPAGADPTELKPGESYSAVPQPEEQEDPERIKIRNSLFWGDEFMRRNYDFDALIPGWLLADGVNQLLGKRGSGKSTVMVDWAMSLVTETPWNETPVAKDWSVVYLCGEDEKGANRFMQAWCFAHGIDFPHDRIVVAEAVPNLTDPHSVRIWAEELKAKFGGDGTQRIAVFLDTWQRGTAGADQNDNQAMSLAMKNAELLAKHLNGCMIVSCHPPKHDEGTIAGSAILENEGVAIIQLTSEAGNRRLDVIRIKGDSDRRYMTFFPHEIGLGIFDQNGNEIVSVYADRTGGSGSGFTTAETDRRQALREEIVQQVQVALAEAKRGLSFPDVARTLLAVAKGAPKSIIGRAFAQSKDVDHLVEELHTLFPPATVTLLDDISEAYINDGRFMLRGKPSKP